MACSMANGSRPVMTGLALEDLGNDLPQGSGTGELLPIVSTKGF